MDPDLASLRREYGSGSPDLNTARNPLDLFAKWFAEAREAEVVEPNAMVLSTVGPSSRTVLLKGFDEHGFSFFTNHDSRKGHELASDPRCALLFGWYAIYRQVRVEGIARMLPRDQVEEYFATRPRGAQLGAWASQQSSVVADREELEAAFAEAERRFDGQKIPPPSTWGGYVVEPTAIEFWQGRENRLHDRMIFTRSESEWLRQRLAP